MTTLTGTREWAPHSVNCITGCAHNCRYCYAREMAHRFNRKNRDDWHNEEIVHSQVLARRRKLNGTIMFPTTHDITPKNFRSCAMVLRKLIGAGNQVLIVSKPQPYTIAYLCETFSDHKDQIEFRFTITARYEKALEYWERNAPTYNERMDALAIATVAGYRTSVSIEPMLDTPDIDGLIRAVEEFVTETIWLGTMRDIRRRVRSENDHDRQMIEAITAGQTDVRIREIYDVWKDHPKIRWKDSIKRVIGLPLDTATNPEP